MMTLLLVILILVLLGGLPPLGLVSHPYGYGPSSVAAVVLIVLLILIVLGRI